MNLTNIFRFRKPEGTDPVNVEDFNDNFDVIDTELNKRPEKTGNASDMVTTFSQAASRANLTPGEKISVSFGKIMKYFADMKTVAFTGSYADLSNKPSIPGGAAANQAVANNCTTTAAGSVLDARQGKVLMDKANQINSDLVKVKVYVGSDGELHFVNSGGADTVLPFSAPTYESQTVVLSDSSAAKFRFGTFKGFKSLAYTLNTNFDDRQVYLYVNNTLIDKLDGSTGSKSGTYNLNRSTTYVIELRSRYGICSGSISLC